MHNNETSAALSIVKSTNSATVGLCDIVTYTLTINNTGALPLNNVIITDPLSEGMTLIPNSTAVNGRLNGYDITSGVSLGDLDVDSSTVRITYRAQATCYYPVYTNQAKGLFDLVIDNNTYSVNTVSNTISLPATYRFQAKLDQVTITLPYRLDVCSVADVTMQLGLVCNTYNKMTDTTTFNFDYEIVITYVNSWNAIEQYIYCNSDSVTVSGNAMNQTLRVNSIYRYMKCSNTVDVIPEIVF